jgi:excisionase family DNA binding protein
MLRNMSKATEKVVSVSRAAVLVGVSRWTIFRAIKSLKLKAIRDNRGSWLIAVDDLRNWEAANSALQLRNSADAPEKSPDGAPELQREIAVLTVRLEAEQRARATAEGERDRWRAMAEKLAEKPRWFSWPWKK